ncbi:MAG: nascent polypeptide-associated complex protein [Desulfurococcales archaeon]|nr:nascent polypeptide-associated complex protein [Desulfurococcales archaeon]
MGFNPRDLRRAMKRMGIKLEEVNAVRVLIELDDGSRLVVSNPQVSIMRMKGQPPMIYVVGDIVKEEPVEEGPEISDEDVALVAEQAGVSVEEARKALEEAGGDIAEAILRLQEDRGMGGQT